MANSITRTLIIAEAERRGYKVGALGKNAEICKVTRPDGRVEMFHGSRPMRSAANGRMISVDKNLCLQFVESLGYTVPPYELFSTYSAAEQFLNKYAPIVVKPNGGEQSKGVTIGIKDRGQLHKAIEWARKTPHSSEVILQKQAQGNLYRLLVINGKFIAAAHRTAAQVTGDGRSTVAELIDTENKNPIRGTSSDSVLKKIDIAHAQEFLGSEVMKSVPGKGRKIKVSAIESVSAGGEAINVTNQVHETWQKPAEEISRKLGLFICGFDIMCPDIGQPMQGKVLTMLETNSMPGFKIHAFPTGGGEPINIAKILFDELSL
jgi:cyanophycin synthetase